MVERDGARLLSIARQWSLCSDDAQDAFQRALEIYLRRAESLDPETELAWLKVVRFRDAAPRAGSPAQGRHALIGRRSAGTECRNHAKGELRRLRTRRTRNRCCLAGFPVGASRRRA